MVDSEHDVDFDATLAGPTLAPSPITAAPPGPVTQLLRDGGRSRELGHYVLLDKLGEGGMGVVFAAYDRALDRKVAIKLLRASGGEAQRRLIREAQAMARLSHPNVVQIYEIGELDDDGSTRATVLAGDGSQPVFIVMEFIDGHTLSAWRRQRRPGIAEILAVFDAAGRGLAAAHRKGLVHRDFKPDNVMIRSDARVVVMDFGLARERSELDGQSRAPVLDDAIADQTTSELSIDLTATGALLGTPAYMSPEQFAGAATDAKTDQFSFCVALWEALHGSRPFAGTTLTELAYSVTNGQRSAGSDTVPTWLSDAVARGLAVDPAARWPSIDALLDALAADPTRRRRWWLAGLGTAVVIGAALGGTALLEARNQARARQACHHAAQALAATWNDDVRNRLEARLADDATLIAAWSHAATWMDDYAHEWATLHEHSCLAATVEHTRDVGDHERFITCLDDGRVAAEALIDVWHEAEPRIVAHAATAAAGLPPLSSCSSEAWLAQRVQPPKDPGTRDRVLALRAELEHVAALGLVGSYEPALTRARNVLEQADALAWPPLQAEALLHIGTLQVELGELTEARASFERASLLATASAHDLVALRAAVRLTSVVGYELSDHTTGRYWAGLAEALLQRVGLAGSVDEAALRSSIGDLQWSSSDYPAALASYEAALALYRDALGPTHPQVAQALDNVGYVHMEQADYARALAHYEQALSVTETALGPTHPNVGESLTFMGDALSQRGDYQQAAGIHERALAVFEQALGPTHPRVADALNNLGVAYSHTGREDDALAAYQRARAISEAAFGLEHPAVATSLNNIATVHAARGEYEQALASYEQMLALELAHRGPDHKHVGIAYNNIAGLHALRGDHQRAIEAHEQALAIFEAKLGPEHPFVGHVLVGLGRAHTALGQYERAELELDRAIELLDGSAQPTLPMAHFERAKLLDAQGDHERARTLARHTLEQATALGQPAAKLVNDITTWLDAHDRR